ncbi:MAG: ATP-binding cassette domain-containing protein [Actinobacteria bacterium]|nr:ATP-binding cassette domain-containing protein [Actinomycetota bacterium]
MIRLEGFRVRAGDFLLSIDELSIERGEYLVVLGPTGSGKTVLLETVAGLRRPHSGRIWFGERDVWGEPPERRKVGLVYQDYALFPHLTVAQNIAFGLRATRRSERGRAGPGVSGSGLRTGGIGSDDSEDGPVRRLAGLLGIDGLLRRYPEGLSGGERQRVALARALAIEPEVLLLDEPLSALDGPTRAELQGELKRVQRGLGATVLHVTHDLDEALLLGDRLAVLAGGTLRQVGAPQHVTSHPVDTEVARLAGLTNVFPASEVESESTGAGAQGTRVVLESGHVIFAEAAATAPARIGLSAVIRAEEIEIRQISPAGERASLGSHGRDDAEEPAERANVFEGIIGEVRLQSVHASIQVEIPPVQAGRAAWQVTVHVLRSQVDRFGLQTGLSVHLRIPVSAVHICLDQGRTV